MAKVTFSRLAFIDIASYLVVGSPALAIAEGNITRVAQGTSDSFMPHYLRKVAARCRALADALDEEAVRLVEEQVQGGETA